MADDEPLLESAALAHTWSRALCRGQEAGAVGCADYHGLRQYWRILDLVTTPAHHDFHAERIRARIAAQRTGRVLISGCADYAQLALLWSVCRSLGREPDIDIVDRCETPLALCRWYARRAGIRVHTYRADILRFRPRKRFDLICTHSFLAWFPPDQRHEVAATWFKCLRPGGKVITVTRLRPASGSPDCLGADDEKETEVFCERVLERAKERPGLMDAAPAQLVDWARQYRSVKSSYGIRSRSAFEDVFRSAGFDVETAALGPVPRREWRRETDAQGRIPYIGLVATRPGTASQPQAISERNSSNLPPGPRSS